jgi:Fe-Mn family superoxide dismutase
MKDTTRQVNGLSRRDALKTLGAGAALAGLGFISTKSIAADVATSSALPKSEASLTQPFALPALGYDYAALEPHIDARTMEIHHTKHHQTYITNANKALAELPDLRTKTAEEILKNLEAVPEKFRTTLRNNVGGHANHSLFWKVIGANGGGAPGTELGAAIASKFGSFDAFKSSFSDAATKRFGSGWAWLSLKSGALAVHSTANQDSPLSEGAVPLLGLDVWEHAYYLHYQNRRADYIAAFWNVVNWTEVDTRYRNALAG